WRGARWGGCGSPPLAPPPRRGAPRGRRAGLSRVGGVPPPPPPPPPVPSPPPPCPPPHLPQRREPVQLRDRVLHHDPVPRDQPVARLVLLGAGVLLAVLLGPHQHPRALALVAPLVPLVRQGRLPLRQPPQQGRLAQQAH